MLPGNAAERWCDGMSSGNVTRMTQQRDEQGRTEPPLGAGEWETLTGFLSFFRQTIAWKTDGLSDEQLRTRLEPSTMTLGGLLKHLALVERDWFGHTLAGEELGEPWESADLADLDWEWTSALEDTGEEIGALWQDAVARSEALAIAAYEKGGLEAEAVNQPASGGTLHLRWIMVHLIEEYGRHCGHADLIRESIDGLVGE